MKQIKDSMRTYTSVLKNLKASEQKLDDILLYVDFIENKYNLPIILMKDGGVMMLFEISGIDHEKLSGEEREACSNLLRTGFTQLEQGYVISNFLNRDKRNCHPLKNNPKAPEIIKFLQSKKQQFWDVISAGSYSNSIFGSIRYWNPQKKEAPWTALINERKLHRFSKKELDESIEKLNQGLITIRSVFSRFGLYIPDKKDSFGILYRMVNFEDPPEYRDDLSLNVQLGRTGYEFGEDIMKSSNGYYSQVEISP